MTSTFSFIVVLGILIFVHEFGHFITAKFFTIKVLKFSLGFGPKLFAKSYGDTEYRLSALPLGGYVKMLGEQPNEEVAIADKARSFSDKPVWQRFLVVLAGPLSNLLFAVLMFAFIYQVSGIPHPVPGTTIGVVNQNSPASEAGVMVDDTITALNDTPVSKWREVSELIRDSNGQSISIQVQRKNETIELNATPKPSEVKNIFGEVVETRYMLGIAKKEELIYKDANPVQALEAGLQQTWAFMDLTVMSVVKIFQRVVPASELGGPIMIASMAGKQFENGWLSLCGFMAVLSINLGIINLFPIPILDGGHLVFFSIEAIRRKPLTLQAQGVLQQFGIVLLGSLMIFVFYNDFARIFAG